MDLLSNVQPGWLGLTMASAAGSSGPGRWWSVTSTCRPSALASATPSTLAMPLSTVISTSAPRGLHALGDGAVRP
jgi:hypothetical protein